MTMSSHELEVAGRPLPAAAAGDTLASMAELADGQPQLLLALSTLLKDHTDVDRLLDAMVEHIRAAMAADRATLFLVDRARHELYSKAAKLPELDEIRLPIGQGIAGHVAATGEVVTLPSARADARFSGTVDAATGYQTESLVAVPVFGRRPGGEREVVGVIEALNRPGGFGPGHVALLEAVAGEIAEALALTHLDDSRDRPARYTGMVGDSPAMRRVYDVIAAAAATDATVLVLGESGTGKELVARAIHANSRRQAGPFVKVDCTSIPETLIEAELFGHEKGAFTGAERTVKGKCELADGGTLFLDELGELPLPLQAKLLRFLQDRELERVGGRQVIKADVRVVAATHRDLEDMVRRGAFRTDLYYRIKVVALELPALRERGPGDVVQLAHHFLRTYARRHGRPARGFDPAALALLRAHAWPGNIRELEHCVESAVVFAPGPVVLPSHLSLPQGHVAAQAGGAAATSATGAAGLPDGLTLEELERRYILQTLVRCDGNRTRAATELGIGRNTLTRKLKQFGIE